MIKESNSRISVVIDNETKNKLQQDSDNANTTISKTASKIITRHYAQGGNNAAGTTEETDRS